MFRPMKPYQIVIDACAAVALFVFCVALLAQGGWPVEDLNGVVVTAAMSVALGFRRAAPGRALGVAWIGAVLQMIVGLGPVPANIAIFSVLYTTAAYGTTTVFRLGLASSLVGAVTITVYLFATGWFGVGASWQSVPLAIVVLFAAAFALLLAWTAGALVRTAIRARENRRAQERAESEAVVEQERVRIARDMHDVVAHSLAVVIAQADGARYAAASDPVAATAALGTISTTARSALADVRLLLTQLRHSQSDGPQPTLADLEGLYAQVRHAGVELRVSVDPAPPGEPPAAVQLAVYRILQEALTNAMRHGDGPVDVSLAWRADRVELRVRNPLATASVTAGGGHGLVGMRERASLVGGRLEAGAVAGEFVVDARIPIGGMP
ncbi:sensor histidine kinase [Microbacterium aoyamense]|uniref:histidine kinase n=1 Tax=Microbacterium aoyamense TaxID=344166 RepID=A0ABN2PT16_9MICO|nr:histidine kinase [Microbacterium aoyamense]